VRNESKETQVVIGTTDMRHLQTREVGAMRILGILEWMEAGLSLGTDMAEAAFGMMTARAKRKLLQGGQGNDKAIFRSWDMCCYLIRRLPVKTDLKK
jgi:hypothetical protein